MNVTQRRKRNIVAFEPCGPLWQMILIELRGKPRGAMKRLMEEAIFKHLGPKYRKLAERYVVLVEESKRRGAKAA
jgi:hypothetical protein